MIIMGLDRPDKTWEQQGMNLVAALIRGLWQQGGECMYRSAAQA